MSLSNALLSSAYAGCLIKNNMFVGVGGGGLRLILLVKYCPMIMLCLQYTII